MMFERSGKPVRGDHRRGAEEGRSVKHRLRTLLFTIGCLGFAGWSPAKADTFDALKAITETAEKICNTVPTVGEHQSAEVEGDIKAELGGLLRKLSNTGIGGTGKYTNDEYAGILQQDLAAALKSNADCKLRVFMTLRQPVRHHLPCHRHLRHRPVGPSVGTFRPIKRKPCGFG
jgi:hypothetical protein